MKSNGRGGGGSGNKVDRKIVEKNRRIHMKSLCFKLSSLIPKQDLNLSKDALSQHDHLDQAVSYITKLKERIERLKQMKRCAMGEGSDKEIEGDLAASVELGLSVVEVRHQDSIMEVVLITGLKKNFLFHEVIAVLEEEGAEVVNASFSIAISSRIGLDSSIVSERLKELIQ